MKFIGLAIISLLLIIIVLLTIAVVFFSLDPNVKYLKYTEEELAEMLKDSLEKDLHKKSKEIYGQLDIRDCQMDESKKVMDMYLRKYDI